MVARCWACGSSGGVAAEPSLAQGGADHDHDRERREASRRDRGLHAHRDEVVQALDDVLEGLNGGDRNGDVIEGLGGCVADRRQPPVRTLWRQETAGQAGADRHDGDPHRQSRLQSLETDRKVEGLREALERQHGPDRDDRREHRHPQGCGGFAQAGRIGFAVPAADPHRDAPHRPVGHNDRAQQAAQGRPLQQGEPEQRRREPILHDVHDLQQLARDLGADSGPERRIEKARRAGEQVVGEERATTRQDRVADLSGLDRHDLGALGRRIKVVEQRLLGLPFLGDIGRFGGARLRIGLRPELRQARLGGIDPRVELGHDRVHLDHDRVDLSAQLLEDRIAHIGARQARLDHVDRALRGIEVARCLGRNLRRKRP